MCNNCGKINVLGFIFCIVSISALGAQDSGTLVLAPNAGFVRIYNDSEFYTIGNSNNSELGTITKTFNTGTWTIDNGYEEKKVLIRQGTTTKSTLKPFPDYGEPVVGQWPTVTGTKDKSSVPAWVVSYFEGGNIRIQDMPQYAGRYCFVAEGTSAHLLTENYLRYNAWQSIFNIALTTILETIGSFDDDILSNISFMEGFSSEIYVTMEGDKEEMESISRIDDRRAFESFLNRIDFRVEEFWWQKRSEKFNKGDREIYYSWLLVTVSKVEFDKGIATVLQKFGNE